MPGQRGIHHLYSNADDRAILKFILSRNLQHRIKGAAIYKMMEKKRILPNRTWQSLHSRMKNYILPNCLSPIYGLTEEEKDNLRPYLKVPIILSAFKPSRTKRTATSSPQRDESSSSDEIEVTQTSDEPILVDDSATDVSDNENRDNMVEPTCSVEQNSSNESFVFDVSSKSTGNLDGGIEIRKPDDIKHEVNQENEMNEAVPENQPSSFKKSSDVLDVEQSDSNVNVLSVLSRGASSTSTGNLERWIERRKPDGTRSEVNKENEMTVEMNRARPGKQPSSKKSFFSLDMEWSDSD